MDSLRLWGVDPGEVGQEEGHQSAEQLRAEIESLMTLRAINTRKTTLRQLEEEHPTHSRFHSIWRQFNFISFTSTLRPLDTCHTQLLFSSPVFPFSTAAKEAIKAGCPPNTPLLSILLFAKSIGICGSVEMPKPVDRWLYGSFEMQTKIAEKLYDTLKQCFTLNNKLGNQIS